MEVFLLSFCHRGGVFVLVQDGLELVMTRAQGTAKGGTDAIRHTVKSRGAAFGEIQTWTQAPRFGLFPTHPLESTGNNAMGAQTQI